jgi:hypothetical protein
MRRWVSLVIVFAFAASLSTAPATATDNQPPTAAAGLDQGVTAGTTVYLDAGGSYDQDGTLTATEWSISAPNGSTVTPSCRDCQESRFTPTTTGRWTVTITVTDDDGATATDTMYVTVEEMRGPSVRVGTPPTIVASQQTPLVVEATADDTPLQRIELFHDGSRVDRFDVSGDSAIVTAEHVFSSTGTTELRAVATDIQGYVNTTMVGVKVVELASGGGAVGTVQSNEASSQSSGSGTDCWVGRVGNQTRVVGSCDRDRIVTMPDGEQRFVDANNDGQLILKSQRTGRVGTTGASTINDYININDDTIDSSPGIFQVDYDAARADFRSFYNNSANQSNSINQTTDIPSITNIGTDNIDSYDGSNNDTPSGTRPSNANYGGSSSHSSPPGSPGDSDETGSSDLISTSPEKINSGTGSSPPIGSNGVDAPDNTDIRDSSSTNGASTPGGSDDKNPTTSPTVGSDGVDAPTDSSSSDADSNDDSSSSSESASSPTVGVNAGAAGSPPIGSDGFESPY